MTWLRLLLLLLTHSHHCWSSTFGWRSDAERGGAARCLHRTLRAGEVGVAHRTLPCGSELLVLNPRTWKFVLARVVDHGPYGARGTGGEWVLKRTSSDPGTWRGCLDLTRAAARAIDHDGFQPVIWALVTP